MGSFRHLSEDEASGATLGTIFWLPPKDQLPEGSYVDPLLLGANEGACNHPVVIVSGPTSTATKASSLVEIAIVTSFHGTTIKSHLAHRGLNYRTGAVAAEKTGYLRIVTASKPYAKDVLKLKNGKGMNRDFAYINIKKTFKVAISTLAKYGGKGDAAELTALAARKLTEAIEQYRRRRQVVKPVGQKQGEKKIKKIPKTRSKEVKKGDPIISNHPKRRQTRVK